MNAAATDYLRDYELIDFGEGRKLESFAGFVVDRPSPAAMNVSRIDPGVWRQAEARFSGGGGKGRWHVRDAWPRDLLLDCGAFQMPIEPKPFGHVGFFPEHAAGWRWGVSLLGEEAATSDVLNLFAYTGAGSLALAVSGARVVHVDAARPSVAAAKRCANLLAPAPTIRFIVDDARKFCARERRRGRRYRLIMMDPPSFGHGPRGSAWRIERDLWPLLEDCVDLLDRDRRSGILIGGHSPGRFVDRIRSELRARLSGDFEIRERRATLADRAGRKLDCGYTVTASSP